jgi:hypothetical protein
MDAIRSIQLMISLLSALAPQASAHDLCFGAGVRPILLLPGFLGSPLFDSKRSYDVEWPDVDAVGRQYSYKAAPSDLDLPMKWKGLVQDQTSVGPERHEGDEFPSMESLFGSFFELTVRYQE